MVAKATGGKPSSPRRRPAEGGEKQKDPTQNVLDSLDAAVQRIDDISILRHEFLREIIEEKNHRIDDMADLRANYEDKLREAEAKRIDAIRAVDVNAVSVANERATIQAATLQTQVLASAEALRVQTATIATGLATQLTTTLGPLTDRVALVEKAQYERAGSSSIADPNTAHNIAALEKAIQDLAGTSRQGANNAWAIVATLVMGLIAIGAVVVDIIKH